MVRRNPRHAHLDGELDPPSHRHFQEEFPIPQLRQVATIAQSLIEVQQIRVKVGGFVEMIDLTQPRTFQLFAHHRLFAR